MRGLEPERAAGVGDYDVDLLERRRKLGQHLFRGTAFGDVIGRRMAALAELLLQRRKPLAAPPGANHARAFGDEAARQGGAETGGRAGNEHGEGLGIDILRHGKFSGRTERNSGSRPIRPRFSARKGRRRSAFPHR